MGLFDHMDDAGERGVLDCLGRFDREHTVAVDRAGVDVRAGSLLDRHALAGDWRLVHRAGAGDDTSVKRNALARLHDEMVAKPGFGRRDFRFLSIRANNPHDGWRQIEQRCNSAPGSPHAPAFKHKRQCKQETYRRSLGVLSPMAIAPITATVIRRFISGRSDFAECHALTITKRPPKTIAPE